MKTVFTSLLLGLAGTLWTAGAQAVPITEPGVHTQFAYRYEFDVTGSDISWPDGSIWNVTEDKLVDDPLQAQTVGNLIHPLRDGIGRTGRVVIEMSRMIEYFFDPMYHPVYFADREWMEVDCLSGFMCDAGWLNPTYRYHLPSAEEAATGLWLYGSELDWDFTFDAAGGGMLRFDGDDLAEGESVTVDGITYGAVKDSKALFQFANARVTRLDTQQQPIPTPLPAPALMLISALGGVLVLRCRTGRAVA